MPSSAIKSAVKNKKGGAFFGPAPFISVGSWQSGLLRRTYNLVKRVRVRSEGPNPSVKVAKEEFDALLGKLLEAKPEPRKKIRTQGKHGPKTSIIPANDHLKRP